MNVVIPKRSRFRAQVNRLERLGIPGWFGIEKKDFDSWLAEFGVTESRLKEDEASFIGLPSGLIQPSKKRDYWEQLCLNLKLSDIMAEMVMPHFEHDSPTEAYVLGNVSFDLQSKTAEKAVKNWRGLQKEPSEVRRRGLTGQELITLIAYCPNRFFDVMLALGSIMDGVVPCLEPLSGYWEFSLHCLGNMMDRKTERWLAPFGGSNRVVAPTAQR